MLDYDTATGTLTITLAGRQDRAALLSAISSALQLPGVRDVVLDMAQVTSLDPSAIGPLVEAWALCYAKGSRLLVRDPSRPVQRAQRLAFADALSPAAKASV